MSDPLGIVCVLGALGLTMGLVRILKLSPELSRKSVHIVLGLVCLSFPWLFKSAWPVILLGILSIGSLVWLRRQKGELQSVLHAVGRHSWGEICFPVAVTGLFLLMEEPIQDYVAPLLVLTLADAMGALIGVRYGNSKYSTDEGFKSLEGSVAFFITAFLSTHICLLLGTQTGRAESLLIAAIIGVLVMLLEGISRKGLDNLWIPFTTYLLIHSYIDMTWQPLLGRLCLLIAVMSFFFVLRRRSYAKDSVLLAAALVLYLIWAVAGWIWALPPVLTAIFYSLICPPKEAWQQRHGLEDMVAVSGVGLLWLILGVGNGFQNFALPFITSWTTQGGILLASYLLWKRPSWTSSLVQPIAALTGAGIGGMSIISHYEGSHILWAGSFALLSGALGAFCLHQFEWKRFGSTQDKGRPLRQFIYGLTISSLSFSFHLLT